MSYWTGCPRGRHRATALPRHAGHGFPACGVMSGRLCPSRARDTGMRALKNARPQPLPNVPYGRMSEVRRQACRAVRGLPSPSNMDTLPRSLRRLLQTKPPTPARPAGTQQHRLHHQTDRRPSCFNGDLSSTGIGSPRYSGNSRQGNTRPVLRQSNHHMRPHCAHARPTDCHCQV